jgi:hypothetical protein
MASQANGNTRKERTMTKALTNHEDNSPENANRTRPSLKMGEDVNGVLQIEIDGDFARMCNPTMGKAVAKGLIGNGANLGSQGKRVDANTSNFAIGFLDAMAPKDAVKALLLMQMAAIAPSNDDVGVPVKPRNKYTPAGCSRAGT